MSLANRVFVVTGGAGFIGSHLVDELVRSGAERVVAVDDLFLGRRENLDLSPGGPVELVQADASSLEEMRPLLRRVAPDAVFDLAVIPLLASLERPAWTFQQNVAMSQAMAELLREGTVPDLVHFSSSEVYGTARQVPMDESHPLDPTTSYAASKAAGDLLLQSYARSFGLPVAILRPFNNFGPRQNMGSYAGVIPLTIQRILRGQPPVLQGDGRQTRDFLYVRDTARCAVAAYANRASRGQVLNVCSGRETAIADLVQALADLLGYAGPVERQPERAADVRRHAGSARLAREVLGFSPSWDFREALRETVDSYRQATVGAPARP